MIHGPKGRIFLISPKFHSPDPVYSLIGFRGRDTDISMSIRAGNFSAYPEGPPMKIPVLTTLVLLTQLRGPSLLKDVGERFMIEIV